MSPLFQSQSALFDSPALDFLELATFSHTFSKEGNRPYTTCKTYHTQKIEKNDRIPEVVKTRPSLYDAKNST